MRYRSAIVLLLGAVLALCSLAAARQKDKDRDKDDRAKAVRITREPEAQNITATTATVTWATSAPGSSVVLYGTNQNDLDGRAESKWGSGGDDHTVELKNLKPNTRYFFRVETGNAKGSGAGTEGGIHSFETKGESASAGMSPAMPQGDRDRDADERGKVRITREPEAQNVTATTATVSWATNAPGSSVVLYGTNPNDLDGRAESKWGTGGDNHTVELRNLKPNTTYYFRVETGQAQGTGTSTEGGVHSFRTKAK